MALYLRGLAMGTMLCLAPNGHAQSPKAAIQYCLAVKWDNPAVDEVIFSAVKRQLPPCIQVVEAGTLAETGSIEIFIVRKGDPIPGPWRSPQVTSNAWYCQWHGDPPKLDAKPPSKLPKHAALLTPFAKLWMRVTLPGQERPIAFEADPRFDQGLRELGVEFAITVHQERVTGLIHAFFRAHPELCIPGRG